MLRPFANGDNFCPEFQTLLAVHLQKGNSRPSYCCDASNSVALHSEVLFPQGERRGLNNGMICPEAGSMETRFVPLHKLHR